MRTARPTVFLVQTVTMAVFLSLVVSPLAAKEYPLSSGSNLLSACKQGVARTEGATLSNFDKARGLMCAAGGKGRLGGGAGTYEDAMTLRWGYARGGHAPVPE